METANNIFIINLDKQTDRWNNIQNYLKNYKINCRRFKAIYGKDLSDIEIKEKTSFLARNFLINHAIIGCHLSHTNLWKQLCEDKDNDFYLIFEDDFVINDISSINKLYNLYLQKKLDYDYLSLCDSHTYKNNKKLIQKIDDKITITKNKWPLSTLGYFITKKGAEKLLKKLGNKVYFHIDWILSYLSNTSSDFKVYNVSPNLIQDSDFARETSCVNEVQKKTLFYYLLPYKSYFNLQYGLTIKLQKNLSMEFFISLFLTLFFSYLYYKTKKKIFIPFIILFLINVVMAF